MGGITSSIAAKLAFFPPKTRSYKTITDNLAGLCTLSSFPHHENVELLKLPTRRGTEIVAVYVRNPMTSSSLLYSPGNAADLGQMYELFIQLSIYLKVNLMGEPLMKLWIALMVNSYGICAKRSANHCGLKGVTIVTWSFIQSTINTSRSSYQLSRNHLTKGTLQREEQTGLNLLDGALTVLRYQGGVLIGERSQGLALTSLRHSKVMS